VVIPAHNPRQDALTRVLHALRAQTTTDCWEALLVDNQSTRPLQSRDWQNILPHLRVIRGDRLGSAFARETGVMHARGELIVFVDDDNVLAPDYLEVAISFHAAHPHVGISGGRIRGEFARPVPAWAQDHVGLLALRDLGEQTLISAHVDANPGSMDYFAPIGAGMVVNAAAARRYVERASRLPKRFVGRRGDQLGGCEDCEMVLSVLQEGLQCAYVPALQLMHLIPESRLRFRYLCRLARQGQESWAIFLRQHEFIAQIPRWTVPMRQLKALVRHRAWTRRGAIRWRSACGYFVGACAPIPPTGGTAN
jgi:glycosyltransferase involved in cell wall biosynthesis